MSDTARIQAIQGGAHARNLIIRWLEAGSVLCSVTGVAMPVMLYRGHSLTRTIALGALANGVSMVGFVYACSKDHDATRHWNQVGIELSGLTEDDPRIADCLATFPAGYRCVQINANKWTKDDLLETMHQEWQSGFEGVVRIKGLISDGWKLQVLGMALLWGTAGASRLFQGLHAWQRWSVNLPLALVSLEIGALCLVIGQTGKLARQEEQIKAVLGQLVVEEALEQEAISPMSARILKQRVHPNFFHRAQIGKQDLSKVQEVLRKHRYTISQQQHWVIVKPVD